MRDAKGRIVVIEMRGKRIGQLTVIERIQRPEKTQKNAWWRCRCACGAEVVSTGSDLRLRAPRACRSCAARKWKNEVALNLPTYNSWAHMLERCYNNQNKRARHYSQRGITVCARWRKSFDAFLVDMGPRPPDTTLGRINNNGNYTPKNCRWETGRQQANNTSRNRLITFRGRTQTLVQWARELHFTAQCLHGRLDKLGWSVKRALTEPPQKRSRD